jgi:hypothetical protein
MKTEMLGWRWMASAALLMACSTCGALPGPEIPQDRIHLPEAGPADPAEAIRRLARATEFRSAAVGVAGTLSDEARAWRVVLASPDADRRFKTLLREPASAAQLYALAGIYVTDRAAFRESLRGLGSRSASVRTMDGCIGGERSFASIAAEIANGQVTRDLQDPSVL